MTARWVKKGVKIGMFLVVMVPVLGFLVMSLWNWLAPAVFGAHTITFWQALGLLILCKILFGGFHGRHGGHWKGRLAEKWAQMTPEEREKLREAMVSRCGRAGMEAK